MVMRKYLCQGLVSGLLLVAAGSAHAVPVTYNFSITGIVDALGTQTVKEYKASNNTYLSTLSSGTVTNAYGLGLGSTITAYGTFTADLGASISGTVFFDQAAFTTKGNILTIDMNGALAGGTLLLASNDTSYTAGGGAYLKFLNGALTDFDYQKTSIPKFNSSFTLFDDATSSSIQSATVSNKYTITTTQSLLGHWGTTILSPVPEASTYAMMLAGLGMLGLMAVRRKSL